MPEDAIAPVVVLSTLIYLRTGPGLRSESLRLWSEKVMVVDIHRWQAVERVRR